MRKYIEAKLLEVAIDLLNDCVAEDYTKKFLQVTLPACRDIMSSVEFLTKRVKKPWKLLQYRDVIPVPIVDLVKTVHRSAPTSCFSRGKFIKILRDPKIDEKSKVILLRTYSIKDIERGGQSWKEIVKFGAKVESMPDLKRQIKYMDQLYEVAMPLDEDDGYCCSPTDEELIQIERERWLSNM